jgi:transposase
VLALCEDPGMSVAQVAMSHGINDNVVHRWRQLARQEAARRAAPDAQTPIRQSAAFVPLALPAPVPASPDVKDAVQLSIKRGAVTVDILWPQEAIGELAGFVRECLR